MGTHKKMTPGHTQAAEGSADTETGRKSTTRGTKSQPTLASEPTDVPEAATPAAPADAWRDASDDLASWAGERLVNRKDAYGLYSGRAVRTVKSEATTSILAKHFRGEALIGLHTTSPGNTSLWLAFDIDAHGPDADAGKNERDAKRLVQRLSDDGFEPMLEDSDGGGSFHLWALFDRPMPTSKVFAYAERVLAELGIVAETFPKQGHVPAGQFGNWLRLPGRHPKHPGHWSRIWSGAGWLSGADAVAELLRHEGDDAAALKQCHGTAPEAKAATGPAAAGDVIAEGERDRTLTSIAGSMRRRGLGEQAILLALIEHNKTACNPPLPRAEVCRIAKSVSKYEPVPTGGTAGASDDARTECGPFRPHPVLTCLADVEPRRVEFLWENRLPMGMLSLLFADGGSGKSWLSLDIAARVSTGRAWPDDIGNDREPGNVVILSCEDALPETVAPRLISANADRSRIHVLESIKISEDKDVMPSLSRDLDSIREAIVETKAKLLIIDPVGSFMAGKDTFKDGEVREVLGPLAKMAMDLDVCVLAIAHVRKAATSSVQLSVVGSVGFVNTCRTAWCLLSDPDHQGHKILSCAKNNILNRPTGLRFHIEDVGIVWDSGPVNEQADEIMDRLKKNHNGHSQGDTERWLVGVLKDNGGAMLSKDVELACEADGYSWRGVRAAKPRLKDQIGHRSLGKNGWEWYLKGDCDLSE